MYLLAKTVYRILYSYQGCSAIKLNINKAESPISNCKRLHSAGWPNGRALVSYLNREDWQLKVLGSSPRSVVLCLRFLLSLSVL